MKVSVSFFYHGHYYEPVIGTCADVQVRNCQELLGQEMYAGGETIYICFWKHVTALSIITIWILLTSTTCYGDLAAIYSQNLLSTSILHAFRSIH